MSESHVVAPDVPGVYPNDCPEWRCPDLSTEDRRDGKTCPDHPCTCVPESDGVGSEP